MESPLDLISGRYFHGQLQEIFLSEKIVSVLCITDDDALSGFAIFGILSSQWSMKKIALAMVPLTQMEPPELFNLISTGRLNFCG